MTALENLRYAGLEVRLDETGEVWVSPLKRLSAAQLRWIRRNRQKLVKELEAEEAARGATN